MKKVHSLLLFLFAIIITGCLSYNQITTIRTDGSGEMFVHYWMNFSDLQDSLLINKLGIFNTDSIRAEFSSPHTFIKNVESYKDFRDSTIHAKVEFDFTHIDSLNKTKAFNGAEYSLKTDANGYQTFSQFIQPFATGFGFNRDSLKIQYTYYLPGKIMSHNASSISNNKLIWEYTLKNIGTGKLISATYRPFKLKETPKWIYYIASLVLVIVVFYLFKKRST
ncbi:MAG: hypothetical protein KJ799_04830 [Bacteroidetes bacterium]|nr:hypothetical protein [Bacteroidota bacterium]MBU1678918.1 hypothetical protein [Bacteroidota bacterium]MBU2506031.1 hypothetical protein [Bacteroidota bacterium]